MHYHAFLMITVQGSVSVYSYNHNMPPLIGSCCHLQFQAALPSPFTTNQLLPHTSRQLSESILCTYYSRSTVLFVNLVYSLFKKMSNVFLRLFYLYHVSVLYSLTLSLTRRSLTACSAVLFSNRIAFICSTIGMVT